MRNMNRLMVLAAMGMMVCATGCATVRGSSQKLKFDTDPPAATVTVGGQKYATPAEVELKRKETYTVLIEKDGYRPLTFDMTSTWDGASMTDFVVPGGSALTAGAAVTGSDRQFYPVEKIKLEPAPQGSRPPVLQLYQYRGKLMNKAAYDAAVLADEKDRTRFMGPENN
jgi:hypothetical protein